MTCEDNSGVLIKINQTMESEHQNILNRIIRQEINLKGTTKLINPHVYPMSLIVSVFGRL